MAWVADVCVCVCVSMCVSKFSPQTLSHHFGVPLSISTCLSTPPSTSWIFAFFARGLLYSIIISWVNWAQFMGTLACQSEGGIIQPLWRSLLTRVEGQQCIVMPIITESIILGFKFLICLLTFDYHIKLLHIETHTFPPLFCGKP